MTNYPILGTVLGAALRHEQVAPELQHRLAGLVLEPGGRSAINIQDPLVEGMLVLMCMGAVLWRHNQNFIFPVWL